MRESIANEFQEQWPGIKTNKYTAIWKIKMDAHSPKEAAIKAQKIIQNLDSNIFWVKNEETKQGREVYV